MTGGGVPIRDFQAHGSSDPSPLQYVALNIIDTGGEGPGTCNYILRTLSGPVKFTHILITKNIEHI